MLKFKKVLSFFVLNIFVFINVGITNATVQIDYNSKSLILAKSELSKIKKGDYYITTINSVVDKLERDGDKEKLEKLFYKLYDLKYKLATSQTSDSKNISLLINYFYAKVSVSVNNIYENEYSYLSDLKEEKLSEYENNTLSESDINLVESRLVDIQLNLFEKGTNYLDNMIEDFDKLSSFEDKGNFKMSFNLNENEFDDTLTKVNTKLNLSDYTSKNSNFDSQLKGKFEAILNASTKGEDDIKIEINSMIDFISKDGNIYLLLEKLNIISEEGIEEIKNYVDELEKISSQNKYIKFEDKETQQILNFISGINPEEILSEGKDALSQSMFKPYKKDGDKFYLIPTKYACDKVKEFMNKFDPFNGDTCSNSQYEGLLSDFAETGDLYITLGNNTKLGFEAQKQDGIDKFNGYVIFSDKYIEELNFELEPDQNSYPGEGLYASYKRNNYINSNLYADKGDLNYTFKSKLDSNNKFSEIDFDLGIIGYRETINASLTLKNKIIKGDLDISSKSYDYDTGSYLDSDKLVFELSGNTDNSNEISSINLIYNGKDLKNNEEYLSGSFKYNNDSYTFENHVILGDFNSDILFDWTWDSDNKIIKQGDLEIIFDIVDYNNDEYKFQNNLTLNNTILKGKSTFSLNSNNLLEIDHNGVYKKDYLEFNNSFVSNGIYELVAGNGTDARNNKRITDLYELNYSIKDYYYDNGEYPSIDKIQEAIDKYSYYPTEEPLGNVEIDGCKFGYTYEVGADNYGNENGKYRLSTCLEGDSQKTNNDGGLDDNRYEIGIDISKEDFGDIVYINGYTSWEQKELAEEVIPIFSGNFNLKVDGTNNKGDFNFYVDLSSDNNKIFDFEIDNQSVRTYKDIEINAPTNYIDSNEVFPTNNYYLY